MNRMPTSHCPNCGKKIDAASGVEDEHAIPEPGDVSICIKCGTFLEFNEDLTVKEATTNTLREVPDEAMAQLLHIRRVIEARLLEKVTYH